MLSAPGAARLKPLLDAFVDARPWAARLAADPLEFPHRFADPRDVELVALLATALAYGRVQLFKPRIEELLGWLGPHPATAVAELTVARAARHLSHFVYRFNVGTDVAVLLLGAGALLRAHGSLEAVFVAGRAQGGGLQPALARFTRAVRAAAPEAALVAKLGPTRGLHHLLPSAEAGAAKRLNLMLRWLVRGPDGIDLGVWRQVRPAELVMPVDTHIARLGQWLGLTRCKTLSWAMAEEITGSLRRLDPDDPVRYDFALCHYGMSGACPLTPVVETCRACPLRPACRVGRRVVV
jgi:uncharacterized protein (TIGR02757 family)